MALVAALVPFVIGLFIGALDREWTRALDAVPNVVIPFMSFAVGTGIDLRTVITGGAIGAVLGVCVVALTGGLTYLGYRFILRRGRESGIGFAAGTTAGNAVAVPACRRSRRPELRALRGRRVRADRDRRTGHSPAGSRRRGLGDEAGGSARTRSPAHSPRAAALRLTTPSFRIDSGVTMRDPRRVRCTYYIEAVDPARAAALWPASSPAAPSSLSRRVRPDPPAARGRGRGDPRAGRGRPVAAVPTQPERVTRAEVVVEFPMENIGTDIATLLTAVAGNLFELVDLHACRLQSIELPDDFVRHTPDPPSASPAPASSWASRTRC
jgi:Kef-type K+ transport system membrane component KefB